MVEHVLWMRDHIVFLSETKRVLQSLFIYGLLAKARCCCAAKLVARATARQGAAVRRGLSKGPKQHDYISLMMTKPAVLPCSQQRGGYSAGLIPAAKTAL